MLTTVIRQYVIVIVIVIVIGPLLTAINPEYLP